MSNDSIWLGLMGAGAREHFVDAGAIRTRVLEAGDGPALILLHGTGGHLETYCRNLGPLSRGHRVVAIDLVGHGYSDRPDLAYDLDDFAGHVVAVMDALGIERATLSGESLGAFVSAWTAITHPDRVERAILNTGILARPQPAGQAQLDDLEQRTKAVASSGLDRTALRHRMEWLVSTPERMTEEMVDVRHRIYAQDGMLDDAAKIMSSVVGMLRGDGGDRFFEPGVMGRLRCPTMVLWTEDNPGQDTELARRVSGEIPDAEFHVLGECAHWPQFERPDAFNELHLSFLDR